MAGSPIVPPGGQFPIPATSSTPLLAFRCAPAIRPYLPEDAAELASIIVDTPVTHSAIAGAVPVTLPTHGGATSLTVTVSHDGRTLAEGRVPLNASKVELPFSLRGLSPQKEAFNLTCTATLDNAETKTQKFTTSAALSFLPDPPAGRSVTKMDLRSGALLAKPATGKGGNYEAVFPIGFYTDFADYLAANLSVINEIKAQGFTTIHPIPTFDNLTALEEVIDRMEELGLYLMYDMRWCAYFSLQNTDPYSIIAISRTYMNSTAVEEEVDRIKNRPNLLLWYTGDEPDGTSGKEYVVQSVLGINHGALGSFAWNAPTSDDIQSSASSLANALTASMADFTLSPAASFRHALVDRVDIGLWTVGGRTLVLATNMNYNETRVSLAQIGVRSGSSVKTTQVFDSGAKISKDSTITLESVGTGGFVLE
ncbi:hypothetical protein EIP86_010022 [Pleurotus ostreatoroseus]|nr:hypothetical protein EIP86_010022 [Pleurotus ostreatoroseus]